MASAIVFSPMISCQQLTGSCDVSLPEYLSCYSSSFKLFLGGQFAPAPGGQFAPARGGQFSPASGGQFDRFLQQPPLSRNLSRFYSRLPRFYKGLKIKKRSKMASCLLWLPRLPEFSGEPATHGLIPSTRDCSNQLLSFTKSLINMKDHLSIL